MRDLLVHTGGRILGQEEVAAELHVSVRTLRRMLEDDGTTFRAIVEQTREHLAEELLVTAGLSVEQVARRLGYTDASTFVHAFRRWKGISPGRWKERKRGLPVRPSTNGRKSRPAAGVSDGRAGRAADGIPVPSTSSKAPGPREPGAADS
ncbi:helix-turn-helix transcriptional regulator [Klenkia terrae]|uniref:helix-turn-helix transcriptional regulator n=1 Tax=Klenkia terrae TaxID=1052259 RepID=UPI00360684AD